MRIFNIMLSREAGGIQKCFLDYSKALEIEGCDVINIISKNAVIKQDMSYPALELPNLYRYCHISKYFICKYIKQYKPDAIIVHGNRAIEFTHKYAKKFNVPMIGITHNYSFKSLKKCDFLIAITADLKQNALKCGYPASHIYQIPNMIDIDRVFMPPKFRSDIVIGSYGRFVEKKGFKYLIEAIKLLKNKGYNVKLLLGGDGVLKNDLEKLKVELGLCDDVIFTGWVKSKDEFFKKIDIFCLPSVEEPFGIVILEAMKYSKPLVATNSEGAREILEHSTHALIAKNSSAEDIAFNIEKLFSNEKLACQLARESYKKLEYTYNLRLISIKLRDMLKEICYS